MRLTGLDLKMEQYAAGERFADRVIAERGREFLNRVWTGPEQLPSLDEIRDPDRWIARIEGAGALSELVDSPSWPPRSSARRCRASSSAGSRRSTACAAPGSPPTAASTATPTRSAFERRRGAAARLGAGLGARPRRRRARRACAGSTRPRPGVDRVTTSAVRERGLLVTNARGVFSRPIAEYVVMMSLAIARRLPQLLELQRERTWQPLRGRELSRADDRDRRLRQHRRRAGRACSRRSAAGSSPPAATRSAAPATRRTSSCYGARRASTRCCAPATSWSSPRRSPTRRRASSAPSSWPRCARTPG